MCSNIPGHRNNLLEEFSLHIYTLWSQLGTSLMLFFIEVHGSTYVFSSMISGTDSLTFPGSHLRFLSVSHFFFLPPLSGQDAADLQHRDEKQTQGSHYVGGCDVLEVDFGEHRCPGDGFGRLSLEHGGRFSTRQSFRPPRQPGRLSDHQLQN